MSKIISTARPTANILFEMPVQMKVHKLSILVHLVKGTAGNTRFRLRQSCLVQVQTSSRSRTQEATDQIVAAIS